jgi:type VI secretion system protein ImpA
MNASLKELGQPVTEDMPSGESLEYSAEFREMESLALTKPESMVGGKDEAVSAPDWKGVHRLASQLREQSRDLRVQVYATIASLHNAGLPEFRDNLELLKIYLEDFWDTVHPQLDPEDDNDPMLRLSTLQMLNEHSYICSALERVKLVELQGMGHFGLREVEIAQGKETPAEGEEVPDIHVISQAFARADPEYLNNLRSALSDAVELLARMVSIWNEKAGANDSLSFDNAVKSLRKISAVLVEFAPSSASGGGSVTSMVTEGASSTGALPGAINSRADVVRLLDRICEYYFVHEPSSPIPLLLRRAQRLVEKSFMEILQDMVPDGVKQAKIVSGNSDENA